MKFDFTLEEVNIILAGLGKLPAENSYELINKVKYLAEAQLSMMQSDTPENELAETANE